MGVTATPEPIPVFQPYIGVDTIKAVVDTLNVGWLGMGAVTKAFEEALSSYLGLTDRYVVAANTGTSALHMALLVAGVGPGDEVITPSFNFVSDHQAIIATGAAPVFCDVEDATLGVDVAKAEALIGPRTKAIVPLHFAGIPGAIHDVYRLAERRGLRVVEDATHAFGTRVAGAAVGSFGDITCFSFDPVKVITSIDGGAVVVPDPGDVERLRHYRLLGIDRDTIERYKNSRVWEYDVVSPGFRYHLTNVNASVGLSQLARADEFIASRRESCRLYSRLLDGIEGLRLPATTFDEVGPFIYCVRVEGGRREPLIAHLAKVGVATGIHFVRAHEFSLLKDCRRSDLSVTDRVTQEILTLPLHTFMRSETVERVAQAIREFMRRP